MPSMWPVLAQSKRSVGRVRVALSSVAEIREHGSDLIQPHVEEAEPDFAGQIDVDWPRYEAIEAKGALITLAAWDDCAMVGYCVAFLYPSTRYRDQLVCQHEVLYVAPEARCTGAGLELVRALDRERTGRDADRLVMVAKKGSTLEKILPRLGFVAEETVFTKS